MNVFITGAGGFIGRQLIKDIAADSRFEKVYCLCRRDTDLPSGFVAVRGTLDSLSDIPPVEADVCIHLAAITNSQNPGSDEVFKTNADGTARVVDFCKRSNIKKIVFLSSINVYLTRKYEYALSKLSAEEHIKNSGLEYSILRCSLVYGKGCQSFDTILSFAKTLHIVPVFGDGEAFEQPIYVDEVSRAIISHTPLTGENVICDLFGKTKMTYNEMVKGLTEAVGTRAFILHLPKKPVVAVAEFCYRKKIPFPIQPEQISHMCEDLGCDEEITEAFHRDSFEENLKKYI